MGAAAAIARETDPLAIVHRELARCREWLQPALERAGEDDWSDLEAAVLRNSAQLWPGREAAIVTQIDEGPCGRVMHGWLAGGDLEEIIGELIPRAEAHARANRCTSATIEGRKGWERALAPAGYAFRSLTLQKAL